MPANSIPAYPQQMSSGVYVVVVKIQVATPTSERVLLMCIQVQTGNPIMGAAATVAASWCKTGDV